jgi:Rrf2 family protein
MLSQTSRYALRILGFLVENQGRRIRGERIAEATGIPANYLSKILSQLRKQGIVDSEKGWGGGFELRQDAHDIRIHQVFQIFDGVDVLRQKECVFGLTECSAANPCPLHPYWERIQGALDDMLTSASIRDLGRTR